METAPSPTFATLLRCYRVAAGLGQEELAQRARLSVRTVGDLERSARHAAADGAVRYALTAPAMPSMKNRCRKRKTSMIGASAMIEPAHR
jgi:DNA-binding XRE family transcriptional regulator